MICVCGDGFSVTWHIISHRSQTTKNKKGPEKLLGTVNLKIGRAMLGKYLMGDQEESLQNSNKLVCVCVC
eukprot:c23271_g2_i1 orf=82-291(+)